MQFICAIYGYEFTKSFEWNGFRFIPYFSSVNEAHQAARDLDRYNLTGVVVMDLYDAERLFQLEAVLSFIEHLDVLITDPVNAKSKDYFAKLPLVVRTTRRHNGGGSVLHRDAFFPELRSNFIALAMDRLADRHFCELTGWSTLFFKATVPFRQLNPYLEVSYFVLFSGLETYVRKTLGEPNTRKEVASLISKRLCQLGFNIYLYKQSDLKRSADTYARLRNALFHNSSFLARAYSKSITS